MASLLTLLALLTLAVKGFLEWRMHTATTPALTGLPPSAVRDGLALPKP
jgi:hypothetical protein